MAGKSAQMLLFPVARLSLTSPVWGLFVAPVPARMQGPLYLLSGSTESVVTPTPGPASWSSGNLEVCSPSFIGPTSLSEVLCPRMVLSWSHIWGASPVELTGWDVEEQIVGAGGMSGCGSTGVMGYKDGSGSKFWEHREAWEVLSP